MKKILTTLFSLVILFTCFGSTSYAVNTCSYEEKNICKTITITGDLSDSSTYVDKVERLLADPYVEHVIVIDPSRYITPLNENSQPNNSLTSHGRPYYTYRITNPRIGSDYIGSTRIATAGGQPGETLSISKTSTVSRTYYCSVSAISPSSITSAVGYDVTSSDSIQISGSRTVPSYHNGRAVAKMYLDAYPIYQTTNFTVQRKKHYNLVPYEWENYGSGYARHPYGVSFSERYIYR